MTQIQINLITKWRGQICGPRVTFPSLWHRRMYERELRGQTVVMKKLTPIIWRNSHA